MPSDVTARNGVLAALQSFPNWLDFEIHGYRVTGARLGAVRAAVMGSNQRRRYNDAPRRGIYVWYNRRYGGTAEYNSTANSLTLGFDNTTVPERRALVVHEAVHALADIGMGNWMHVQTSEACAHLAQCIILMEHFGRDHDPPTSPTDANRTNLYREAWAVAQILHRRMRRPTWGEYENIWNAVATVRDYSSYGLTEDLDFHGVTGVPWNVDEEQMPNPDP